MLIALSDFFKQAKTGSVSMIQLTNYTFSLLTGSFGMIQANNKHIHNPLPSVGLDHINGMLIRVDMDYLLKYPNDIERFGKIEKIIQSPSFSRFTKTNVTFSKAFIRSNSIRPVEYVIPTTDLNTFDEMPWESDNIDDWMTIRPLRMLACPSFELSGDNLTSQIRFSEYPPLEAMFSLNIGTLLLLYTKDCILNGVEQGEGTNRYPFIYKSCILPLLYDNCRSWLLELFTTMAMTVSLDSGVFVSKDSVAIGKRALFAERAFNRVMDEVRGLLTKCRDGKIGADAVMRALSIRYGYSLIDEIDYLRDSHYVEGGLDMYWLTFLKEYDLLKLILLIYTLDVSSSRYRILSKALKIRVRRLRQQKFWNSTPNPAIKAIVKSKFEDIAAFVDY